MKASTPSSHGAGETRKLVEQLREQLTRLVQQLEDLEECKDDLDAQEYEQTKQETLDQMKDFEALVRKTMAGNMTLVDELGSIQLAMQATVSRAFKTPEVIKLFAKREPGQLRQRLASLERDLHLTRISKAQYESQAVEILIALNKLGDPISPQEAAFVSSHTDSAMAAFEKVSGGGLGTGAQQAVLQTAGGQIKNARK